MQKANLWIVVVAVAIFLHQRAPGEVIVIAHPGVKTSEVTRSDLNDFFTGNASTFKDGGRLTPVLLNDGKVQQDFLKMYIGKSDTAYRAGWRSLIFTGQATMPKTLDGDPAVVAFVQAHPGTVGYIDKSSPHTGVKVIAVR